MEPEKICAECGDNLSRRSREKRSDGQYMCVRCVVRGRERERRRETLRTASAKVAVGVLIAIAALLILAVMLYLFGDIAAPGKTMSIGNADLIFPGDVTDEEAAAGFALQEIEQNGRRLLAVVANLPRGLRAIKAVHPPDVQVEYAIWDESGGSLYLPAHSLAELLRRFPRGAP